MTVEQFMNVKNAVPFLPFRLHMANGRFLDVWHRDFVSRSPSGRTIVMHQPDDRFEIVNLLLVSSIEILDGKSLEVSGNGRGPTTGV